MLETKRLNIRLVTLEDVDDIFKYTSNPHTMRYEKSEFKDKQELLKMLDYFVRNKYMYVVIEKGKDNVFGHITLTQTQPPFNKEFNIGYIFNEDYHGLGYCTEASKAVMNYGFHTLKIHRIRAACNPENIASWKVMEKLGMKKEAHFKERVCFRNDMEGNPIYTDEYVYAINYEDYIK